MGCITAVCIISRFLSGPVYSYHGYFRFGSGFMPVFVKFYGSLMAHGYGSEKSRAVTARFDRGFGTVTSPGNLQQLMVHGYGSEESRVVTARFNRGLTAVMYRGFGTVKSPGNLQQLGP